MDKVKGIWQKVKDVFKKMGKGVRILLIVGLVLIVGVVAAVLIFQSTRPYVMLFSDLTTEDMSNVVTYLQENGVTDYRIRNNDTILVPEAREPSLRAGLLQNKVYPQSGFSYSTYLDNIGMLSSESDREQLRLYETQDRLGATISLLDGVQSAVVNITPEEDNRWVLNQDDLTKASASVVVTMKDGYSMTNEMADTIRNLLLTGVKGLDMEHVTVADETGKTWSGGGISDADDATALMLSLQAQVDENVRNKVIDLLEPIYGAKNLSVEVNSAVDVSKTYEESITYHYPDETAWDSMGGHGLIDEWVWDNSIIQGDEGAGGVVGTTTNADLNEYVTQQALAGNAQEAGASGSITYKHDVTTTQKENYGGVITDVMVSVVVNSNNIEETNQLNMDNLVPLVARAAGISTELQNDKIIVVQRPFHTEPVPEPVLPPEPLLPNWAIYAMIAGFALFLLLLLLILLLRSRAKKRKARKLAELQQQQQQQMVLIPAPAGGPPEPQGAQIMDIQADKTMELRQDVRKFVEDNPEIAAQMVKTWLRGGEDVG